jgi:hypothetical protein
MSNYADIIKQNLDRLYNPIPVDLAERLLAKQAGKHYIFPAFGELCRMGPERIQLADKDENGARGVIISLYALQAQLISCKLTPFQAFREMPDSMPYVGAFASHVERVLDNHIEQIENHIDRITSHFKGSPRSSDGTGDFSIRVYPLPKIALYYIFYRADDEFPASVTCLFSHNAATFLPTDALADTGEYTSKKILDILFKI